MTQRSLILLVATLATLLAATDDSAAQSAAVAMPARVLAQVPMKGAAAFGGTLDMATEVFTPTGAGPFPVLIYAHGRSGTVEERSALRDVVPREYLSYWLAKGFAVVGPARPGYGTTGGSDREIPGHRWEPNGSCTGVPDPAKVAATAGKAIVAAIAWTREQPWADASRLLLSGNSVGGLTSTAVGAGNPNGVIGYINFAGGVAGHPRISPGKSCAPEKLRDAFAEYGKTTRIPNLWLYAENDLFWGPDVPKDWHAAFSAGGSATKFVMTAPLTGQDGHELIFVGRKLWQEPVDTFLLQLGFK